jgi:outer membrane protein assembly factor BamE (lipoprotein component of BamABCDE complex)
MGARVPISPGSQNLKKVAVEHSQRVLNISLSLAIALLAGCASFGAVDGVENLWREVPVDSFEEGETTQAEVLELLGPPSQLIGLKDQTVFYYLTEKTSGKGYIFIFWNQVDAKSEYDRAIFFFDGDGVLEEFAYSQEEIAR